MDEGLPPIEDGSHLVVPDGHVDPRGDVQLLAVAVKMQRDAMAQLEGLENDPLYESALGILREFEFDLAHQT